MSEKKLCSHCGVLISKSGRHFSRHRCEHQHEYGLGYGKPGGTAFRKRQKGIVK